VRNQLAIVFLVRFIEAGFYDSLTEWIQVDLPGALSA